MSISASTPRTRLSTSCTHLACHVIGSNPCTVCNPAVLRLFIIACMPKSFAMPGERYMLEKKNLASYAWPAKLQSPSLTSSTGLWRIFSPSAAFRIASSNTSETSSWGSTGSNTSKISARQVGSSARKLVIVASHNLRLGTTTRFLLVVLNLVVRQLIWVSRATTWLDFYPISCGERFFHLQGNSTCNV